MMYTQRRLFLFFLTIASLMLLVAFAASQAVAVSDTNDPAQLPGSWMAEINTPTQGTFPALLTFTADGGLIASESPLPFESTGHGSWMSTGDNEAAFTFIALFGNEEGRNTGKLKVSATLHFNPAKQSWGGPFQINVYDAKDKVVVSDAGTFNLSRIEVEPLE